MLMKLNMEMYEDYWQRYPYDKYFKDPEDPMYLHIQKAVRIKTISPGYYVSPTADGTTFLALGLNLAFPEIVESKLMLVPNLGICDNPKQFIDKYDTAIRDNLNKLFVLFLPIITEYNPNARAGFNVDDWGQYLGDRNVKQYEFLEHNDHIRVVWAFKVYQFALKPPSKKYELRGVVAHPKILGALRQMQAIRTRKSVFIYPTPKSTPLRFRLTGTFANTRIPPEWFGKALVPDGVTGIYDCYIGVSDAVLELQDSATLAMWIDTLLYGMKEEK